MTLHRKKCQQYANTYVKYGIKNGGVKKRGVW